MEKNLKENDWSFVCDEKNREFGLPDLVGKLDVLFGDCCLKNISVGIDLIDKSFLNEKF